MNQLACHLDSWKSVLLIQLHGHLGNCKKYVDLLDLAMMTYLHSYLERRSDCCCIFMSIFTNDLKTIQAAFVTFIRQNGANKFNMAIKSSGHDRALVDYYSPRLMKMKADLYPSV